LLFPFFKKKIKRWETLNLNWFKSEFEVFNSGIDYYDFYFLQIEEQGRSRVGFGVVKS
jgi:hypothetical protein